MSSTFTFSAAAAASSPHLGLARKAEKKGDTATALSEFRAAVADEATDDALLGVARTEEASGELAQAYDDFQAFLASPPTKPTRSQAKEANTHLEELASQTGTITLTVTPADAIVEIDGKARAAGTLARSLRVAAGSHIVSVHKPSFVAHSETVQVAGGADRSLAVALEVEQTTGHVEVREAHGRGAQLTIDGTAVGPLPWSGDLQAGAHKLEAQGIGVHAAERSIDVTKGGKMEVVLEADVAKGTIDLAITGELGVVLVDGQALGVGHYRGTIAVGHHQATFTREGYESVSLPLEVTETGTATATATLTPLVPPKPPETHESGGVFTLLFAGSVQANGAGSESEKNCSGLGTGCNADPVVGGGLFLGYGHEWAYHLGFDVQLGFTGDTGHRQYTDASGGKVAYFFDRAGGIQAVRFRTSLQGDDFRATLAIGPGISERAAVIGLSSESSLTESVKGVSHYLSPGLDVDLSAQWRFTRGAALAIGAILWVEDAGNSVDSTYNFAGTPGNFRIVSGPQAVFYPYLGFVFGP